MNIVTLFTQILVYSILYLPVKIFFRPQIIFEINKKSIKRGIVIAANHQSRLDLFLIFGAFPPRDFIKLIPIKGLVAEKYMDNWWKKILLTCFGTHALKEGIKNSSSALLYILDKIDKKETILLFPEGKVIKEGEKVNINPGLGYLALKRKIKIVPVYLSGFRDVNIRSLIQKQYRAKVCIGKPQVYYKNNDLEPKKISEAILNKIYSYS